MSILTIGGDLRYAHMTRLAAAQSIEIAAVGLENCPFPLPAAPPGEIARADVLILPNPFRSGMQLPYSASDISLTDVLTAAENGALVLLSDSACVPDTLKTVNMADLSSDAEYVLTNAHLTAEGAVCAAMKTAERALTGSMCLVIGAGRIGKRLALLLKGLGADTAVAVRRDAVRRQLRLEGLTAFSMEELQHLLPRAHFIFSTPPDTVLDEKLLRLIRPEAYLMDLASPPYGFDLALAHSLSLNACRENGLPGRYCPLSAGAALLEAVKRALNARTKGGSACS